MPSLLDNETKLEIADLVHSLQNDQKDPAAYRMLQAFSEVGVAEYIEEVPA